MNLGFFSRYVIFSLCINWRLTKNGFGEKKVANIREYQIPYPHHRWSLEIVKGCGFLKAKRSVGACLQGEVTLASGLP